MEITINKGQGQKPQVWQFEFWLYWKSGSSYGFVPGQLTDVTPGAC